MESQDKYGLVEDGAIDIEYSETRVVNVTDEPVTFKIAGNPGSPARRYRLAPFGKDGSSVSLQSGYCNEFLGAGSRFMLEPIIERLTKRHPWPSLTVNRMSVADGVMQPHTFHSARLPMVVREEKAREARKAWLAEMAKHPEQERLRELQALARAKADAEAIVARERGQVPQTVGEVVGDEAFDEEPPPDPDADVVVGGDEPPPEVAPRAKRGGRA